MITNYKLKEQIMKNNLTENIQYVFENKNLSAREAECGGATNLKEIMDALKEKKLDNNTNRDEELEKDRGYKSKVSHSIRYISGLSSKGQMLISVLRDDSECVGLIRDMGTTIGLFDKEKFLRQQTLDGKQWLSILDDIKTQYRPPNKDSQFINLIEAHFEPMTVAEKSKKYSIEDIFFNANDDIRNFVETKQVRYEINLFTTHLHDKDMTNANLPENPWEAYNYYMTPCKKTERYKRFFLGTDLIDYFKDKDGADKFSPNKIMSTYGKITEKKMVNRVIPIYMSYCISRYVELADLDEACVMIARFSDYKKNKIFDYWSKLFRMMVDNATKDDIISFYEDEYLNVFKNTTWDMVTEQLKKLNLGINKKEEFSRGLEGLRIQKWDTGIYFIAMVLAIKYNKYDAVGLDKLVSKVVNNYNNLLNTSTQWENKKTAQFEDIHIIKYFSESKTYSSNSVSSRVQKIFSLLRESVLKELKGKQKDRSQQAILKEDSLTLFKSAIAANSLPHSLFLFPLSQNDVEAELQNINYETKKNLEWTHPNDDENKAIDGFLGMYDDNHHKDWKNKNWKEFGVHSQKDYLTKLLKHNIEMKELTECPIKKDSLKDAILFLKTVITTDLEVK